MFGMGRVQVDLRDFSEVRSFRPPPLVEWWLMGAGADLSRLVDLFTSYFSPNKGRELEAEPILYISKFALYCIKPIHTPPASHSNSPRLLMFLLWLGNE